MEINDLFGQRKILFLELEKAGQKRSLIISNVRLTFFLVLLVTEFIFIRSGNLTAGLLSPLCFLLLYVPLVSYHQKIRNSIEENKIFAKINELEIQRSKGILKEIDGGAEFLVDNHPYAKDLDILGPQSLFQYLNRCSSQGGKRLLSEYLLYPKLQKDIISIQESVKELIDQVDFRQKMQMLGIKAPIEPEKVEGIHLWFNETREINSKKLLLITVLLNLISLSVIISVLIFLNWKWIAVPVFINLWFLYTKRNFIKDVKANTGGNVNFLISLYSRFLILEKHKFSSEKLSIIQQELRSKGLASGLIKRLYKRFEYLEYAQNPYFNVLANSICLWDLHWCLMIHKSRNEMGGRFDTWLQSLYEYEVIASIAGTSYANKDWVFPEISNDPFIYKGKDLAHPLIFSEKRIANNFHMEKSGLTWILTGSNMSGKSTYLRTLGINAVLALAGGPVCASELKISVMKVFSSMRTEDNLQENTSSFYAELKRLRLLLESFSDSLPVFYLLDEILKGTNSADRHIGGKALLNQLQKEFGSGIIATHDLDLGKIFENRSDTVLNYSFNSEFANEKLLFDYKLREGICKSFNASALMKQIGIEIE